jgi:hypothetical protein
MTKTSLPRVRSLTAEQIAAQNQAFAAAFTATARASQEVARG